jgi:FixJ family two-component response regulator
MTTVYIFQYPLSKRHLHQQLGDSQMSGGTDGQKFGQAFDNAQNQRLDVIVLQGRGQIGLSEQQQQTGLL